MKFRVLHQNFRSRGPRREGMGRPTRAGWKGKKAVECDDMSWAQKWL